MNIYIYIMKNLPWIKKNSHKDFREDITAVSVRRQSFCPSWWFHTCRCSEQQGPEWHNDTNTGEDGWLTNTLLLNMTLLWISQHYSVTPVQQHISECSFNKLKNPIRPDDVFFSSLALASGFKSSLFSCTLKL